MRRFVLLLLITGCSSHVISPAQHVENLKAELAFVKLACGIYQIDKNYPRDAEVSEYCEKLLK